MWEIILWIGAFLIGLTIVNIDFPYWFREGTDRHWYFYFVSLYIIQIIGYILTTIGIYQIMKLYSPTFLPIILLIISGFLTSYTIIGFLYSAYDLAGGKKTTWLAPNIEINIFTQYIVYIILLSIAGILGIIGEKLLL